MLDLAKVLRHRQDMRVCQGVKGGLESIQGKIAFAVLKGAT